jgi:LysM repeat protein
MPLNCPPAFLGRYTVISGDTFYNIAQIFRVRFEALAVNNPHITDPNVIFPGDVLCVPGLIPFPCCTLLKPQSRVPFGTGGVVYINFAPRGGQSVSFMATLPQPSYFGNFTMYTAEILIPSTGRFGSQLYPTPEDPPTWSIRVDLPTAATVKPNSRVIIHPTSSNLLILEGIIRSGNCQS